MEFLVALSALVVAGNSALIAARVRREADQETRRTP